MMSNDYYIAHVCTNGGRISNKELHFIFKKDGKLHELYPKTRLRLIPLTPVCVSSSEVILSNIDVGFSGIWECVVTSSRGNASQRMEIVVLETSATYCPADRVTNNKGDFRSVTHQQLLMEHQDGWMDG